MNLENIVSDVVDTVFDSSVTEAKVISKVNEGLAFTAELVLFPLLEATGTVTTTPGQNLVDLPSAFSRNLFRVKDPDGLDIDIYSSTGLLEDDIRVVDDAGVVEGDVEAVALQAAQLFYAPSPADATVLSLRFYTAPTPLSVMDAIPICIPTAHRMNILCNYAKWQLFNDIEDGVDGEKINTRKYEAMYYGAATALEGLTTQGQSRPRNREARRGWF